MNLRLLRITEDMLRIILMKTIGKTIGYNFNYYFDNMAGNFNY
jgi:hypothetical protein